LDNRRTSARLSKRLKTLGKSGGAGEKIQTGSSEKSILKKRTINQSTIEIQKDETGNFEIDHKNIDVDQDKKD
jgi:hypothetical protein